MSKSTRNSGKLWTSDQKSELRNLANHNTPTRVIGLKLGRTEEAIRSKASRPELIIEACQSVTI